MILSDSELETRLKSPDNIINLVGSRGVEAELDENIKSYESGIKVIPLNPDRGKRGDGVGDKIRGLIGRLANESDETQAEVGTVFGVTQALVSQTSRGLVNSRLDSELTEIAKQGSDKKTETAHDLALDSLVASLGLVKDKLGEASSLKESLYAAEKLSRVVGQLKGSVEDKSVPRTLVVVTMPSMKREETFEVIDV